MSDQVYVYAMAMVILGVVALGVIRKSFDPLAPRYHGAVTRAVRAVGLSGTTGHGGEGPGWI